MDIKINNNGDILIATSNGLNLYNDSNDTFISLSKEDFELSYSKIFSVEFYNDNEVYMISNNNLIKYDIKNNEYTLIKSLVENNRFTAISLYEDIIYLGSEFDDLL